MARRTRSILVDANIGKIFINTDQVVPLDPSKLIAGTKLQSTIISLPKKLNLYVAQNLGTSGRGKQFPSGALLTNVAAALAIAPVGADVIIDLRYGSVYETSTLFSTLTIPAGTKTASSPVSLTIPAGEAVFIDIVQAGTVKRGVGLQIALKYYTG